MAIGLDWKARNYPEDGFTSITFPITVEEQDPCERGWYFAYQFHFIRDDGDRYEGNRGYTGVQPRPNSDGSGFHAYCPFSRWGTQQPGDIVDTDGCHSGADGSSGVTCNDRIAIPDFQYGREYLCTVETDAVHGGEMGLWRGFVTDSVTLEQRQLGAWWAPQGQRTKGLRPWESAFTEFFLDPECHEIPYARIRYGVPYSITAPDAQFTLGTSVREGEWCRGKQNFSSYLDTDGTRVVEIGWRQTRRRKPEPRQRPCHCAPHHQVIVNGDVNIYALADTPRIPPRGKGSEASTLYEFQSADGMSWMGVTLSKGIHGDPALYIDVDLKVRETPDGPWAADLGADKDVEITGELTDGLGRRWTVGGGIARIPADEHTYDLTRQLGGPQSPPFRLELWTVHKSGGYWADSGDAAHVCSGTINHTF